MNSPVIWSASATHVEGNIWRITVSGEIESGYHIYDCDDYPYGATATEIAISGEGVSIAGDVHVISEVVKEYDDVLELSIGTISGTAVFTQDIELAVEKTDVDVNIYWMACTEDTCTPPAEATISVPVGGGAGSAGMIIGGIIAVVVAVAGLFLMRRRK